MTIEIRFATEEDLKEIVYLNRDEYWEETSSWSSQSMIERWQKAQWWADIELLKWHYEILELCEGGILVAVSNNQIIGELDFVKTKDSLNGKNFVRYHIIWILVAKSWRRMGIATKLINNLQKRTDLPIWVEAEDDRSNNLYRNLGRPIVRISNWECQKRPKPVKIDSLKPSSFQELQLKLNNGWQPLIGRYFAPCFDYTQIQNSEPVHKFMWGNTLGPEIKKARINDTEVMAVLTQYPRILINLKYVETDLSKLIQFITREIFNMGFVEIYIQIYNTGWLEKLLVNIGYKCVIENDPVYQL